MFKLALALTPPHCVPRAARDGHFFGCTSGSTIEEPRLRAFLGQYCPPERLPELTAPVAGTDVTAYLASMDQPKLQLVLRAVERGVHDRANAPQDLAAQMANRPATWDHGEPPAPAAGFLPPYRWQTATAIREALARHHADGLDVHVGPATDWPALLPSNTRIQVSRRPRPRPADR